MKRVVDLKQGVAYVVTDLHGEWAPYEQYRDHFLRLYEAGQADYLIFCGDIIHGYRESADDHSLAMVLDIMQVQAELGRDRVIMLAGNHELPHVYGITLAKGDLSFTPRFEHSMGSNREAVIEFFRSLPFVVRTAGGVMLTHAGAHEGTANSQVANDLMRYSHEQILAEADRLLEMQEMGALVERFMNWDEAQYERMAKFYLSVSGVEDPRYSDLLRGIIVSNGIAEFESVWNLLFTQCEKEFGPRKYRKILSRFLEAFSGQGLVQRVLVTGHIVTQGGYEIVADQQLRLSSWAHARPRDAGSCLLFDVQMPVSRAADLRRYIHPMP